MEAYLTRLGTFLTMTPAESCGQYVTLHLDEPVIDYLVREIAPLVYVVRINGDRKVHLVVFRRNNMNKPRNVLLHDVLDTADVQSLSVRLFMRLLSFDNNRLGNRDRNMMVPIIRQTCPEYFKGHIDNENGRFHFTVYKTLLTIFNEHHQGVHRSSFVKLSRSIKDALK